MPTNYEAIPSTTMEDKRVTLIKIHFTYDPETGKVYHKQRIFENPSARNKQWNTRFAGKEAGFSNGDYFKVSIGGKKTFYVHQVAFACMKGYIPDEIDHEDKNKINNKWDNLREALHNQNSSNVFKRTKNKSGYKGVSWSKNCWRMDIQHKGIKYYSYHRTVEEAYLAYKIKSIELHGAFGSHE